MVREHEQILQASLDNDLETLVRLSTQHMAQGYGDARHPPSSDPAEPAVSPEPANACPELTRPFSEDGQGSGATQLRRSGRAEPPRDLGGGAEHLLPQLAHRFLGHPVGRCCDEHGTDDLAAVVDDG